MQDEKLDFNSPNFDPLLALRSPNVVLPVKVLPLDTIEACRFILPPTDPNFKEKAPIKVPIKIESNIPQNTPTDTPPPKLSYPKPALDVLETIAGISYYKVFC
jgi:hypothetical protein